MNVLVIPEDSPKDRYVLKPIVEAMMKATGKPRANVVVCGSPRLRGIVQALNRERIEEIINRYKGMHALILLIVDRDGEPSRRFALNDLEKHAGNLLGTGKWFFAENAWQEVEVWVLAGLKLPPEWVWEDIRSDRDPKERYFNLYALQRGVSSELDGGRKSLAEEAALNYSRIRTLSPEIGELENRVRDAIKGAAT